MIQKYLKGFIFSMAFICYWNRGESSFLNDSVYSMEISAKDLSENVSLMSSHNDELLILIYEWKDTNAVLNTPALAELFTLDTITTAKTFSFLKLNKTKYMLFLIELDEEGRTVEQIDPVLRIYRNEIMRLYDRKKYTDLDTYLGDEDLLGYLIFDPAIEKEMEIKGRQSLDSYHYILRVE